MLCSCAWDFTSWNSGCAANNDLYPPDKLEASTLTLTQTQIPALTPTLAQKA